MRSMLEGASDNLKYMWKKRDEALEYERKNNMAPRTSEFFKKAQKDLDDYFLPQPKKAQRKKPKKKPYIPDEGWAY